jgi:hemolysin III
MESEMATELPEYARISEYTPREEVANSVTAGIGAALSIAALSILAALAGIKGDPWRVVSFSIFGAALVLLYLAATLYHAFRSPRLKSVFQFIDHISIYILIAGTYTPFMLVSLRGGWGWSLFGVIWGLAVVGIVFKSFFMGRFIVLSTVIYLAMGWLILIALKPALAAIPARGLLWVAIGGCAYTIGVGWYAWRKLPYNHAIWHLFMLAGSICHFFAVLFYVLPGE